MRKSQKSNKGIKIESILIGIAVALFIFFLFGLLTVLVPNYFFKRMTPIYWYDYIFLLLTSILIGIYAGLWRYAGKTSSKCSYGATGGAAGSFLSFGCPICNKLLVSLLGVTGVMAYFAPIQPILGIISISILFYVVYKQYKTMSLGRGSLFYNSH